MCDGYFCAGYGDEYDDEYDDGDGYFNPECGHARSRRCTWCGICMACDGCYCGED